MYDVIQLTIFMKFFITILLILFISGCKPSVVQVNIQKDIDSIAGKWVPDQRENIFSFSLKMLKKHEIIIKGETNVPEAKNEIMNYLTASGMEYSDSLKVLPDTLELEKTWGLVTLSVCNIKKNPSHSSELVSQAIMGTPVKILKKRGSWLLVQTPDHYIGWTSDSGIMELNEKEIADWKQSDRLIFTGKSGDIISVTNVRGVVSDIVAGSIIKNIAEKDTFYVVELPDGRHGLINKKEVMVFSLWCSNIRPEADRLINFAKLLTGSPYMWGGTSTKATDCSGFVKTIYFTGGVILARDASLQFQHGEPVDISSSFETLNPGDLIFFGHKNSIGEKIITHVGMHIGDTEVIHSSGMVRINSLDSSRTNYSNYLKETIMGARRIIGSKSERGIEAVAMNNWYIRWN